MERTYDGKFVHEAEVLLKLVAVESSGTMGRAHDDAGQAKPTLPSLGVSSSDTISSLGEAGHCLVACREAWIMSRKMLSLGRRVGGAARCEAWCCNYMRIRAFYATCESCGACVVRCPGWQGGWLTLPNHQSTTQTTTRDVHFAS
jgi:hypothetical protein